MADQGREGGRCAVVSSADGADAAWFVRIEAEPDARYRLSGWIKTDQVRPLTGQGALLNIHGLQGAQTGAVAGSADWTYVELEFDTGELDELQINCLLGGWGLASGTAYYDDIRLELIAGTPRPAVEADVTIDAAAEGAPISKYIYGQFIEHLGRCIYGGIWAEMLEDRKFYYAVSAEESPWKAIGPADAVTMVTENAYVGEHMPRIQARAGAAHGIVQDGLGLVKGKAYTGRIVLAGAPGAAPVRVTLKWGDGPGALDTVTIDALTEAFATYPLAFTAGADTDGAELIVVAEGAGRVDVGTLSLMPGDNIGGMRADTLALLEELDGPVYRWPGGNFVSGYDWRDGIGDPDKRPPRKNPAWKGVEHNDFGADEFIAFCREIGTEPLVVVNSGLGDIALAFEELEYFNGAADTQGGAKRAANGHPEPYAVHWWGIGNEMYGGWQLGHMPLEDYVKKHNAYAEAMRAKDPSIKLVGVGATGPWSETMLAQCADHMDLLSEHFYCGEKKNVRSHVRQIPNAIRNKVENHRRYHDEIPALEGKRIPICMDEWNYWYGDHVYGELGTRYYLKDALGIAAGLHEFYRSSSDVFMANYAQTVNVIGCIKTTQTAAAFDTTGLVLKLYRHVFGTVPVSVRGESGDLDAMAAWTEDRKAITLGVVNPLPAEQTLDLAVRGAQLSGAGTVWTLTGPDPMAHNAPGGPQPVTVEDAPLTGGIERAVIPACSVRLYVLEAE